MLERKLHNLHSLNVGNNITFSTVENVAPVPLTYREQASSLPNWRQGRW